MLSNLNTNLVIILSTYFLFGCEKDINDIYENDIKFASCDIGELYIHEKVDTRTGSRGGVFAHYSMYLKNEIKRVITTTTEGIYIQPEESHNLFVFMSIPDNTKLYPTDPNPSFWHLFMSPNEYTDNEFMLVTECINNNLSKMMPIFEVSREPHEFFPSRDRVVPNLYTARYLDLTIYRKKYICPNNASISVNEGGRIDIKHNYGSSLIGTVINNGKGALIRDKFVIYDEDREKINDPIEYIKNCTIENKETIFDDFIVSITTNTEMMKRFSETLKTAKMLNEPNKKLQPTAFSGG